MQVYLNRERMQARNMAPIDVMSAVETSNVFLPTGEAIVGDMDYFLDSNSMFEKVPNMGEIPLADRARQPRLRRRRRRADRRRDDPDDDRPGRRTQAGLHPRDAAEGGQHADGHQPTSGPSSRRSSRG